MSNVGVGCVCERCSRVFFVLPQYWKRSTYLCPLCNPLAAQVERNAYRWKQMARKAAA
jgi:hypothetical protein